MHSSDYRRPQDLPTGRVLIVGGGNTGFQIAEELAADRAREVHLSVGSRQTPLPTRVFGRELFSVLQGTGLMAKTVTSRLGRRLKGRDTLVGSSPRRAKRQGIQMQARTVSASGRQVGFDDGTGLTVDAVVWATGFDRDHSWIDAPVFDQAGRVVQERGVTASPGLYFLGLPWMHTRGSALLGCVKHDAAHVAEHIAALAQDSRAILTATPNGSGGCVMSTASVNPARPNRMSLRSPILWGVVVGVVQAATPLAFWWLDSATTYAVGLAVIAAIYIGFAVADGRPRVIAVESSVAFVFVVIAAAAVTELSVAPGGRTGRPRTEGPVAAPQSFRRQHPLVASVLHGRRLGRRGDHRRRDRRRNELQLTRRGQPMRTPTHHLPTRRTGSAGPPLAAAHLRRGRTGRRSADRLGLHLRQDAA